MSQHTPEEIEAVQAVVDRVSSYQESAPEGTVAKELAAALSEAGIDLPQGEVDELVGAIEADGGDVDAASILG